MFHNKSLFKASVCEDAAETGETDVETDGPDLNSESSPSGRNIRRLFVVYLFVIFHEI